MSRRLNQFVAALKQTPVPVVPLPDGRHIWFISTGAVDANIKPISQQEVDRKAAEIMVLQLDAADNLAAKLGLSPEDARERFVDKEVDGVVIKALNPIDYLSTEARKAYFVLSSELREMPTQVASRMIRYRVAYQLEVAETAKVKAKQLYIHEPWFYPEAGDRFKFDKFTVTITEPYDPESGSVGIQPLPGELSAGDVGFQLRADGYSYKMGDREWDDENNDQLSLEDSRGKSQIDYIYEFYQKEAGRDLPGEDEEGKSATANSEKALEPSSKVPLLTGENSTGESKATELEMNGSAPTILETAQSI